MTGVNYKQKFIISIVGLMLAYTVVYVKLMESTVDKLYYILNTNHDLDVFDLEELLIKAKLDQKHFTTSLNVYNDELEIQHFMIDFISRNASNRDVMLNHIYEPHDYSIENYKIVNQAFEVKGDFKSLVKLIYKLETNSNPIQIQTIRLESKKNQSKNKNELYAIMYVQSVASI
jgi:hypothetical protein